MHTAVVCVHWSFRYFQEKSCVMLSKEEESSPFSPFASCREGQLRGILQPPSHTSPSAPPIQWPGGRNTGKPMKKPHPASEPCLSKSPDIRSESAVSVQLFQKWNGRSKTLTTNAARVNQRSDKKSRQCAGHHKKWESKNTCPFWRLWGRHGQLTEQVSH